MKNLYLILVLASFSTFAQNNPKINYNNIITTGQSEDIGEKLVQIAWQNKPLKEIIQQQIEMANQNIKVAKSQYFNDVALNGNFNEYNTNLQEIKNGAYLTPKVNIGLGIRISTLMKAPADVKRAVAERKMAEEKMNEAKIYLRAAVLRAYENWKFAKQGFVFQKEVYEDASTKYTLGEKKFKDGKMTLDELNRAYEYNNNERTKEIQAENKLAIAKIDLEELIGVKLEEVGLN